MKTKSEGMRLWAWILGPMLAVVSLVVLIALFRDAESAGPEAGVALYDIADDPTEFYGTTVTVSGEVNEVLGPRSFTIGDEELLVVSSAPLPEVVDRPGELPLSGGDVVKVTGRVRNFDVFEVEREIGADLDDELLDAWAATPSIVADSVSLEPAARVAGKSVPVALSGIADAPEEFLGQIIMVDGAAAEAVGPNAFVIVDDGAYEKVDRDPLGSGVLVVTGGDPIPDPTEERPVEVTGILREFGPAAFEEELGIELDDGLYAGWDGRPAIAARSVHQTPETSR